MLRKSVCTSRLPHCETGVRPKIQSGVSNSRASKLGKIHRIFRRRKIHGSPAVNCNQLWPLPWSIVKGKLWLVARTVTDCQWHDDETNCNFLIKRVCTSARESPCMVNSWEDALQSNPAEFPVTSSNFGKITASTRTLSGCGAHIPAPARLGVFHPRNKHGQIYTRTGAQHSGAKGFNALSFSTANISHHHARCFPRAY